MKRIVSMVVAVLLLVTLSIPSFAVDIFEIDEPLLYEKNGYPYIGTLITSKLNERQKDFMRMWLNENVKRMLTYHEKDHIFCFYILSDDTEITSVSSNPEWAILHFRNGYKFSYLSFDAQTGELVGNGDECNIYGTSYSSSSDSAGFGLLVSGSLARYYPDLTFSQECTCIYNGYITFVDDDGLLEQEEPEPEPEEPEPAYNFPEVKPIDSEYVAYDVTIWNKVANTIKQSVGSSINICWLILAFVMSWLLVARVVKKMSK